MKILCTITFLLFIFVSYGYAEPNKIIYELQEKCGKICNEMFQKEYGKGGIKGDKDETLVSNYSNHYNSKLNRCFILITTTTIPRGKERNALVMKTLFDINENKEYGAFSKFQKESVPFGCMVGDKGCKSQAEFEALIKPYMEE